MSARPTLVLAWLVTGIFAVTGSLIGRVLGPAGLFAGAIAGGALGVVLTVLIAVRLGWLATSDRVGAVLGGWGGFGIAAPIAALHLHTQQPIERGR